MNTLSENDYLMEDNLHLVSEKDHRVEDRHHLASEKDHRMEDHHHLVGDGHYRIAHKKNGLELIQRCKPGFLSIDFKSDLIPVFF